MVAADFAATFPDAVAKLVLMSPIGIWRDDAPIRLVQMLTGPPEENAGYLFANPDSEAAQAMLALPADPELIPKAIAQTVWNIGCTTKFAWPIADHGLAGRLHRVRLPTLVLWGREDALVPVAYAEEFGTRIAGSHVQVLEGCGHVLQVDQPELTWAALSQFLAS
jgi:pimeloyl-ACP methyl ester carboxylesterase